MELILITRPDLFAGETELITALLHHGLRLLHVRKPDASAAELEDWLRRIPTAYYPRLTLHDHHHLAVSLGLGGIHLNARNPQLPPGGFGGRVSRSCHTLDEVRRYKPTCDYVFLSPLFPSLSKPGYVGSLRPSDLDEASASGLIDRKVVALGGIDESRLGRVRDLGFGGVALLGDVWGRTRAELIPHYLRMQRLATQAPPAVVLTIAGSDSSGGAGIQADIKTISSLGAYAASIITAVTAQNTMGVRGVHPVPADFLGLQIDTVLADLNVQAVKIGMVGQAEAVAALTRSLDAYAGPVVYDPVMISTSGHRLMEPEAVDAVCRQLIPRCALITPNLHEARLLSGRDIRTVEDMERAAIDLSGRYTTSFLLKGGHLEGGRMCDVLCQADGRLIRYDSPRVDSQNLHGTGCTLSSAIATFLALHNPMEEAVGCAKRYVTQAITEASHLRIGQGHGPLWHFFT